MPFELNNNHQSNMFFQGVKKSIYSKVYHASKKSNIMRATGPIIAMPYSVIALSESTAAVGESAIKGLANVLGAPFSKKCSALTGLKQLAIGIPTNIFYLLFSPFEIIGSATLDTIGMLVIPETYSGQRAYYHGLNESNYEINSIPDFNSLDPLEQFRLLSKPFQY